MKRLAILLVAVGWFGWIRPASATVPFRIQRTTCQHNGAGTFNCTVVSTKSGSLLAVEIGIDGSGPSNFVTPIDNKSSVYNQDIVSTVGDGGNGPVVIYSTPNTVAGITTITNDCSSQACQVIIEEWGGIATVTPFDQGAHSRNVASQNWTTGTTATLAGSNELAIAIAENQTNCTATNTPTGGFGDGGSNLVCGTADALYTENQLLSSSAGIAGTGTFSVAVTGGVVIAVYKSQVVTNTGGQFISGVMLPQVTPISAYPPDAGYTLTPVTSGANLQTAINAAACGTKLNLAHNGSFTTATAYTLPNNSCACHTDQTKWIIIQSDTFEANYTPGIRTDPSVQYPTVYPHITSSDVNYGFTANANGASCWGFAGLDLSVTTDGANAVIGINVAQTQSVANYAHDFAFWGVYLHGYPTKALTRGIVNNGNFMSFVDSYCSDFHVVGQDNQCIVGWDGIGGELIQNSFLEAATENYMSGGADPANIGIIRADLTFKNNHFFKPLAWRVADPTYVGIHWAVKNIFELKFSKRLLITGNVYENSWGDGQIGNLITINTANSNATNPSAVNQDITFYYNVIRHGVEIYQLDGNSPVTNQPDNRFNFHDNLAWDIDSCKWGLCYTGSHPDMDMGGLNPGNIFGNYDMWFNHETMASANQNVGIYYTGMSGVPANSSTSYGHQIRNSIFDSATNGSFFGNGVGAGDNIVTYTPAANFNNNCMYGTQHGTYNNAVFSGKQFPANQAAVFVAPGSDFHVAGGSACHAAASDGLDMGANIDLVNAATSGVVQTLANIHTVTTVSPTTFTHLGNTTLTVNGTNFISGEAQVSVGGAGPIATVNTVTCAVNTCTVVTTGAITLAVSDTVNIVRNTDATAHQGQFTVASWTDVNHFTYTDTGIGTVNWSGGTANRISAGALCTSPSVTATQITCQTPAGTVGHVPVFVHQFGIPIASTSDAQYN